MGPTDDSNSDVGNGINAPVPTPAPTAEQTVGTDLTTPSDPTRASSPETSVPEQSPVPEKSSVPEPILAPKPTPDPVIASTVTIPAGTTGEGGEWSLLQEKVQAWINDNQLSVLWQQVKLPAQILIALIVLILVLQAVSYTHLTLPTILLV